jgi:hypothetical protein
MDDLLTARVHITDARQLIISARMALARLQSTNPNITSTMTLLATADKDMADELSALLSAHDHLTDYRISLL